MMEWEPCAYCSGSGLIWFEGIERDELVAEECPMCEGFGEVRVYE